MGGDDFSKLDVVQIALDSVAAVLGIDAKTFRE
jgi:hypothetical protein